MDGLWRRAAMVAGAGAALLGPVVGVASTAGGVVAGTRLAAGGRVVFGGSWGMAIEVPGTAALNQGGSASIYAMSCAWAGSCSAGGQYIDSSFRQQAFVVSEVHGRWGAAEQVPGIAALNRGGGASIASVSCASAGNCSAAGTYLDSSGDGQVFVVNEVNGSWGTAIEVPGTAALNQGGNASIYAVSCASAGSCSAGGEYTDRLFRRLAFVVSEVHGRWGAAIEVPGTLTRTGAGIGSVSCAGVGECSAGGGYLDRLGHAQAFVVSEVHGIWGTAKQVPGTAALSRIGAGIGPVSCAGVGQCSAGGGYLDRLGHI